MDAAYLVGVSACTLLGLHDVNQLCGIVGISVFSQMTCPLTQLLSTENPKLRKNPLPFNLVLPKKKKIMLNIVIGGANSYPHILPPPLVSTQQR